MSAPAERRPTLWDEVGALPLLIRASGAARISAVFHSAASVQATRGDLAFAAVLENVARVADGVDELERIAGSVTAPSSAPAEAPDADEVI